MTPESRFVFRLFAGRDAQAQAAAAWLADALGAASDDAPVIAALAGGESPVPVYQQLARQPLDWANIKIMPTDERCVPPEHPRSNVRMLRQTLGADKQYLPLTEGAGAPSGAPSVTLLGAGADGHVASLFAEEEHDRQTLAVLRARPASQPEERLTLPPAALAQSPRLLLFLRGKEKLAMLLSTAAELQIAQLQAAGSLRDLQRAGIVFGAARALPLAQLLGARQAAAAEQDTAIYYAD